MVKSNIPSKFSKLMSERDLTLVEAAIAEAEKNTDAEIVVVIADRSGSYDRTEDLVGLAIAVMVIIAFAAALRTGESGAWDMALGVPMSLGGLILILVASAICGSIVAARLPWLVRRLVPRRRLDERVKRRGAEAFMQCKVSETKQRVGLLIYVSVFEHKCWVAGDRAVQDRFGETSWNAARDHIVSGFKQGEPAAGLCSAIEAAGKLLVEEFPKTSSDLNELPNRVHFLV